MIEKISKLLEDGDVELRRQAVIDLRSLKDKVPAEDAVRLLLRAMQDPNWRVRKTAIEMLSADYPPESYLKGLLNLLQMEGNAGARSGAMEAFVRLGKGATGFLMREFETPDADTRKFIIDILGQINDRKALPLLLGALNDRDENVRAAAVEYLGCLREATVVERLIEIMRSGDLWTAYPAVEALGKIGDPAAVPALEECLAKGPLKEVALRALAEIGDTRSIDTIVPLVEDRSKSVQHEALVAISTMYHGGVSEEAIIAGLRKHLGERAVSVLLNHAWSSRHDVRVAAILFLGMLRDLSALEPLMELSQEEEYRDDVKRALVFIGREQPEALMPLFKMRGDYHARVISSVAAEIAVKDYFEPLIDMLAGEDGHVRSNAMYGLMRIGDERAITPILGMLTDPYVDVQEMAVECLARFHDWLDLDGLARMLHDPDPVRRKNVAALLGKLGRPSMAEDLSFAMQDENAHVRRAAINAMANIPSPKTVEYLMAAITDEDTDNRISAILGLGAIAGEQAVEPLLLVFGDDDDMLKVYAIKALGMIGSPKAMPDLIKQFDNPNGFVVSAAIEAVSKIGGAVAVDALRRLLPSRDDEIRRTAIRALGGFIDTEELIYPFLEDSDWATRAAAVESLAPKGDGEVLRRLERSLEREEDSVVRVMLEKAINDRQR